MLSELLLTEINRLSAQDKLPLHRQLYEALRRAILDGKLAAGDRLPSSRDLVQDLGMSRNTVVAALSQLAVEGYLVSRVGSGTFVNDSVPKSARRRNLPHQNQSADLSRRGRSLATTFCAGQLEIQPFTPGIADFNAFPVALWQRLQNKHWRMTYPEMLDYNDSGGYAPLRRAVADYLRVFRSVPLDVEQVIITSGTRNSGAPQTYLRPARTWPGSRLTGLLGRSSLRRITAIATMTATNETALRKKHGATPRPAMRSPPSAGPRTRDVLMVTALRPTALARSSGPTIS